MTKTLGTADTSRQAALSRWDGEGGAIGPAGDAGAQRRWPYASIDGPEMSPPLMLVVDETVRGRDGLPPHGPDSALATTAFIDRKVMDTWASSERRAKLGPSLPHGEYDALGARNLPALGHIVRTEYGHRTGFDGEHPFGDILPQEIAASAEWLDRGQSQRTH